MTDVSSERGSKPLTIGVFGGSFNPIHLGHALLAITTQQTKAVDQVVLVPVYQHAVKRNLLPFEDRVNMCELAIQAFGDALTVSTVEKDVGASNGAMLKALKKRYPSDTKFLWICGDDFIRWMDKPKGLETLQEVHGLIVQRRLHKQEEETASSDNSSDNQGASSNRFIQEPLDEAKLHRVAKQLNLEVDFIYGELPHFSSTLVRRAPGHWRSFLTQAVIQYLDERPHLLQQLIDNLNEEGKQEPPNKKPKMSHSRSPSTLASLGKASSYVIQGLDVVHALQIERGRTALYLSTGKHETELLTAQKDTDARSQVATANDFDFEPDKHAEAISLVAELQRVPQWLNQDRGILRRRSESLAQRPGEDGWTARLFLVEKFDSRIDVLIGATIRALVEILQSQPNQGGPVIHELLSLWSDSKEALGRLRAFVCAAGPQAPQLVRSSLAKRTRLNQIIDRKEREIARVLAMEAGLSSRYSAPETLHRLLQRVTLFEYKLMGTFSPSTPIPLIHKYLEQEHKENNQPNYEFDVEQFFDASTAAIDFLLTFAKALTAYACATA